MTIAATLQDRNVRTANSIHQDGCYFASYDLANNFGAVGAAIAASRGRYIWVMSPDHPAGRDEQNHSGGWFDGQHINLGFSSDPGLMPGTWTPAWRSGGLSGDPRDPLNKFIYYHFNDLVYNPDDATYPFYLYCEGYIFSGPGGGVFSNHECGVIRSPDLVTWTGYGGTHQSVRFSGFTSFQRVVRNGAGDWFSIGPNFTDEIGLPAFGIGKWTSTDALNWTTNAFVTVNRKIGNRVFNDPFGKPLTFTLDGSSYMLMREDARVDGQGMYLSAVPVDSNYGVIATGTPPVVRLSAMYDGLYPGLGYLQLVTTLLEDGVIHVHATHGYYSDEADPADGNHDQAIDYYTIIADASLAANAAPAAVRAECRYGAVIITWRDALPNKTYRVYRSTDGGSTYPTHVDVTGLNYVDPVGNVGALYYYKVVTLNAGVDKGFRVVPVYVSNGRTLTNEHIKRVTLAGGTDINAGWLDTVTGWLRDNCLTDRLLYWVDPSFGVVKDGSNHIAKVFCVGSTLRPPGGDYTPDLPATTLYNATGLNSTIPAFVNSTGAEHGYFGSGRVNNIRRKAEATMAAVYSRPNGSADGVFFATSEFGGIWFMHGAGTPGQIEFHFKASGYDVFAAKAASAATGAHFAVGTFDGTDITAYCDGAAGTKVQGVLDNFLLDGQRGGDDGGQCDFLGAGSSDVKFSFLATPQYGFDHNQGNYSCAALIVFDIALSAAQVASLTALLQSRMTGTSYSLPSYDAPFVKNIKTDYSATGNGTSDDASAFATFASAVATWQATHTGLVVLQSPAGNYRLQTNAATLFTAAIKRFLWLGESRHTTQLLAGSSDSGCFLGSASGTTFDTVGMHSARFQTVAAGASTVTLVTSAQTSIFSVGNFVVLTNGDLQGYGDPINPNIFEFKQIQSIGSGTLSFTSPLENAYKSTWPLYNDGSNYLTGGGGDKGGPATVFYLDPNWGCEHEYRELDIHQVGQTKSPGRFITYTRCKATVDGVFPTENQHWIANDLEQTGVHLEIDKVIDVATLRGGVYKTIEFQSSSPNRVDMLGGVMVNEDMLSTPRVANLDSFYVAGQLRFGPTAYGVSRKVIALNGVCGELAIGGFQEGDVVAAGYTMAGGIIKVANSHGPVTWAVPGATLLWAAGSAGQAAAFKVTDLTQDATFTYVHTDQPGGFPGLVGTLSIRTHAAPILIMRGVQYPLVGTAVVIPTPSGNSFNNLGRDLSHVKPFVPIYSRSQRRYTNKILNAAPDFTLFGQIVSITIEVPLGYTGAQSTLPMNLFGQFGGRVIYPDGTQSPFWNPIIDLKTAGTRVITPTGVTGSGGTDANLTLPATPLWLDTSMAPYIAHDISGEAPGVGPDNPTLSQYLTITFVLDQNTNGVTGGGGGLRTFACHFV